MSESPHRLFDALRAELNAAAARISPETGDVADFARRVNSVLATYRVPLADRAAISTLTGYDSDRAEAWAEIAGLDRIGLLRELPAVPNKLAVTVTFR